MKHESIVESESEELLTAAPVDSVTIRLVRKIKLAEYESIDIDISVHSYQKDGEKFGETFERVFDFVDNKLAEKVDIVEGN